MRFQKILAFAFGPLANAALGLLLLPLISWFFSAQDIAQITLMQTHASLVLIILGLGLDQAYIREFHASQNSDYLFKNIILPPLFLLITLGMGALFLLPQLAKTTFIQADSKLGLALWLFVSFLFFTRYLSIILRMHERAWAFSFSQTTPKLLLLLLIILFALMPSEKTTAQLAWAYAIAQVLTVVFLAWQTRTTLRAALIAPFNRTACWAALRYGLPLMVGGLAYWGLVSIDKFLIREYSSLSELGIYAMATAFSAVALIVQSIFATIWAPTVFRWVENGSDLAQVVPIFRAVSALIVAVLCLTAIFSPIITLLLPASYAPVQFIVLSSMLYPLLYTLTEVSGIGINVQKKTSFASVIALIAMIANWVLCRYLIPDFGARGAAVATAISFWLFFILKTEVSSRLWLKLPRTIAYGYTLPTLLFSSIYTLYGNHEYYPVFALISLCVLLFILVKYRFHLIKFINKS